MFYNEDLRKMAYDNNDIDINITNTNTNQNVNTNMNTNTMGGCCKTMNTTTTTCPVVEAPQERCVYRNIYHEVPHVCPINTRIINNHIYRHTYQPRFTCSEENVVTQEQCGSCCNFR